MRVFNWHPRHRTSTNSGAKSGRIAHVKTQCRDVGPRCEQFYGALVRPRVAFQVSRHLCWIEFMKNRMKSIGRNNIGSSKNHSRITLKYCSTTYPTAVECWPVSAQTVVIIQNTKNHVRAIQNIINKILLYVKPKKIYVFFNSTFGSCSQLSTHFETFFLYCFFNNLHYFYSRFVGLTNK